MADDIYGSCIYSKTCERRISPGMLIRKADSPVRAGEMARRRDYEESYWIYLTSDSVVPNYFGNRDQFLGRQFFHGPRCRMVSR